MFGLRIIAIVILGSLAVKPALAQALPSCFSVASDADGDGYGWENNASCVITATSLQSPAFTNLETGDPVNLVRARWSSSDFAKKGIVCSPYHFDGEAYSTFGAPTSLYEFQALSQTAPYNGNVVVHGETVVTQSWSLDNGLYSGPSVLAATPWVEIIDLDRFFTNTQNATRVWSSNESYSRCANIYPGPFVPSDSLQTDLDNCDYTNAAQHDGWGWNAVTGQSCEPLASTNQCIDTDGDGWGWDGTKSCRLE